MKLLGKKSRLSTLRQSEGESWALALLCASFVVLHPGLSFAAGTLGDVICNAASNLAPYGDFITAVAYATGLFLLGGAAAMFKQHSENPGQAPLSRAAMKAIGGAACMALPKVAQVVQDSVFGVGTVVSNGTIGCTAGAVTKVASTGATGSGAGLDALFTNLFGNISAPLQGLLSTLCLVMGAMLVARGLMRAAKYGTDQKASLQAILANLIIGAILLAVGQMMDVIMSSLFGIKTADIVSFPGINWSVITSNTTSAGLEKTDKIINSILVFVQVVGMISFVRGWLIIKTAAEGGQASMVAGATHIIGGVMAINISGMAVILEKTFGTSILKQ